LRAASSKQFPARLVTMIAERLHSAKGRACSTIFSSQYFINNCKKRTTRNWYSRRCNKNLFINSSVNRSCFYTDIIVLILRTAINWRKICISIC